MLRLKQQWQICVRSHFSCRLLSVFFSLFFARLYYSRRMKTFKFRLKNDGRAYEFLRKRQWLKWMAAFVMTPGNSSRILIQFFIHFEDAWECIISANILFKYMIFFLSNVRILCAFVHRVSLFIYFSTSPSSIWWDCIKIHLKQQIFRADNRIFYTQSYITMVHGYNWNFHCVS